eukprot:3508886-Pyramimonas_sp.AAC.1
MDIKESCLCPEFAARREARAGVRVGHFQLGFIVNAVVLSHEKLLLLQHFCEELEAHLPHPLASTCGANTFYKHEWCLTQAERACA